MKKQPDDRKKILLITNSGIGLYCFRKELVSKILQEYGVILVYPDGVHSDYFISIGCKFIQLDFDSSSTNPINDLSLFRSIWSIISTEKPDMVMTYTIKPCIYAGMICRLMKIPVVSTVTGISPALISDRKFIKRITTILCRLGYRRNEYVFFQNKFNFDLYKKRKLCGKRNVLVNGSGVNLKEHVALEYNKTDHIKFVFLGRLIKIKGLEELAEAIMLLKEKYDHIECKVVGQWIDDLPKLKEAVEKSYITHCNETDDPDSYYGWCDAVIMPSYGEGMSNVVQEACACGRPALASNIPGCKDIIENGVTGLLFEPRDVKSLTAALENFIELTGEQRMEMGRKARIKMEEEFDRDIVIDKYMEALATL